MKIVFAVLIAWTLATFSLVIFLRNRDRNRHEFVNIIVLDNHGPVAGVPVQLTLRPAALAHFTRSVYRFEGWNGELWFFHEAACDTSFRKDGATVDATPTGCGDWSKWPNLQAVQIYTYHCSTYWLLLPLLPLWFFAARYYRKRRRQSRGFEVQPPAPKLPVLLCVLCASVFNLSTLAQTTQPAPKFIIVPAGVSS